MISIIIPTLNEEKTIENTLKLLRVFTGDYEIIISDGGSHDNTIAIAKKYTDRIVTPMGDFQNIAIGKNSGSKVAQGEYLVFLDADIVIPNINTFFKKAVENFESNPNLVGLSSFIRTIPEAETKTDIVFRAMHNYFILFMNNIIHLGSGAGEFQMVRASAFNFIGGFDHDIIASEDYDLFRRLAKVGDVRSDSSLVVYEQGRRAHKVGWFRLFFFIWLPNGLSVALFKKSISKKWKEIR